MRAGELDAVTLNGWAMLGGGVLLLAASGIGESWGKAAWTAESVGSIAYLAFIVTAATVAAFGAATLTWGAVARSAAAFDTILHLDEVTPSRLLADSG